MESAFWDASSLVPLCVTQASSSAVQQLSAKYAISVWWASPVEVRSAIARLVRTGLLIHADLAYAHRVLSVLRSNWTEIQPSETLRNEAESFVDQFQLKAADAQQLAAAYIWASRRPPGRVFLSGDAHLLAAAKQLGFQVIST